MILKNVLELPMTPSPKKTKLKPFDSDLIQSSDAGTDQQKLQKKIPFLLPAFWIRIRSDPYHLVGSGSVSGNVDMDPGSQKLTKTME